MPCGFEWDETKRRANVAEHGVDFVDAALIFRNPVLEAEDRRGDYGELRLRALGHVGSDFSWSCSHGAGATAGSSAPGRSMSMEKDDTRRYSLEEIEEHRAEGRSETRHDAPAQAVDDAFWRDARVVMPPGKTSVHLRLDADVLAWFKAQGPGHLTRMNAVLRSYVEAHRRRGSDP